ncbi:carbohydrate ABC transporter permease [Kineothrix sp. MB12-C1]|uniref:carbohydrate ABC transporter permease n=1 Tax=Kineothrix sp. MB12-C1 TaxID=3070215 RepID=UPI0027D247CA|nr:carbohydrate ABC transporter permease [Kineothrix sp. MB12-C1]WMC93637.1 carbohydrate ABC transporter permease [Kineothrix sp. MB12-C1]
MKRIKKNQEDSFVYPNTKRDGWIAFAILTVFAVIMLIPLGWIVISSFKMDVEIQQAGGFLLFPKTWTLGNFKELLSFTNKQLPIYKWFVNSLIVSGSQTIIAVVIYSMSAYAYAKLKFKGRDIIFLGIMFLSSFPAITTIIPLYKLMHVFGWLNGPLALIAPGLAGVMNIFLIRQFMYAIPDVILESAKIDGAGEWRIFSKIVIPNCKPILIAVGLFTFTANWNDFLWPSIAINNIDNLTLTAGLQLAKGVYGTIQVARMCTVATIAIIPMVILYIFTQKYFVRGISLSSGVKG